MTVWTPVGANAANWTPVGKTAQTWTPIPVVVPVNILPPAITGAGDLFDPLSVSTGTWLHQPASFAYAWYLDGVLIDGETDSTYFPTAAGSYTAEVTATNRIGSTIAATLAVTVTSSGASLLSRLLAVPGLVSAYDARDTSSLSNASVGASIISVADKVVAGDKKVAAYLEALPDLSTAVTPATIYRTDSESVSLTIATVTAGKVYAVTWSGAHLTGFGGFRISGGGYLPTPLTTNAGPGTYFFRATNSGPFTMTGDASGFEATVSSVSLKEVGGNLLLQSTSTLRPKLAGYPNFDFDGDDDLFNLYLPSNLGSSCAIYYFATADETHHWLTAQTLTAGLNAMPAVDLGRLAVFSALPSEGDQAIAEAWGSGVKVPPLPDGYLALDAVFEDNFPVSIEGAIRDPLSTADILSRLTDNGDGSYSLTGDGLPQFYPGKAATITLEYETAQDWTATPPSGTLLHWYSVNPLDNLWEFATADPTSRHVYMKVNGANYDTAFGKYPAGEGWRNRGRRRNTYAIAEGVLPRAIEDNFLPRTETVSAALAANGTPTKLTFFKNGRPGATANPLANAYLHRVQIRVGAMSNADIEALQLLNTVAEPIHLVGDSFLNGHYMTEQLLERIATEAIGYVPISQDGVGGSTLAQQLARMQAYAGTALEKWYNSTLVIMDGGLTDNTPADCVNAIDGMVGLLNHDRWIYMQPPPENWRPGAPERDAFDAKQTAIQAYAGDRFIPTITASHAYAIVDTGDAGYAADQTDIADNMWPASLHFSDHIHLTNGNTDPPNSAGYWGMQVMGRFLMYDGLVGLGFLP